MPEHWPAGLAGSAVIEVVGQGQLEARLVGGGPPVRRTSPGGEVSLIGAGQHEVVDAHVEAAAEYLGGPGHRRLDVRQLASAQRRETLHPTYVPQRRAFRALG